MSVFVPEDIGFETSTMYKGTHSYVVPEMKKLFVLNSSGFVDLYFNDVYGLQKSLA